MLHRHCRPFPTAGRLWAADSVCCAVSPADSVKQANISFDEFHIQAALTALAEKRDAP
jgi:hypothetical protein